MKQKSHAPGLHVSLRLYRWLLKLHTSRFDAIWGEEMLLMHKDAYVDEWQKKGFHGVLKLWGVYLADTLPEIYEECKDSYRELVRGEITMREFLSVIAPISSTIFMGAAGAVAVAFWIMLGTSGAYRNGADWGTWFIILFDGAIAGVGILCLIFWKTIAAMLR